MRSTLIFLGAFIIGWCLKPDRVIIGVIGMAILILATHIKREYRINQ